ncbi:hypothetical protein JXB12_04280 [candidate division KSB1 bacterium]|nr:hypothetical protein [candidate division KSB1 bacterium]
MNVKKKSYIILLATFIIGIMIGIMLDRCFMSPRKIDKIAYMKTRERLAGIIFHVVQPKEDQIDDIKRILEDHSQRFMKIENESRENVAAAFDSLMKDLSPILTDKQEERLQNKLKRLRNWEKWRSHPPHPPREHRPPREKPDQPL